MHPILFLKKKNFSLYLNASYDDNLVPEYSPDSNDKDSVYNSDDDLYFENFNVDILEFTFFFGFLTSLLRNL